MIPLWLTVWTLDQQIVAAILAALFLAITIPLTLVVTPEDAARLTVQVVSFIPRYLRALAVELMPESAEPAPPAAPGVFIHNGQLYRYDGFSVTQEQTTQPTRQPPPKSPES